MSLKICYSIVITLNSNTILQEVICMKKKELLIILFIIILAFFVWFVNYLLKSNKDSSYLLVTINGETYKEIPLNSKTTSDPIRIDTPLGYNIFTVEKGVVNMTEANCPDLVCVHTAPASEAGEMIVCLPHKVVLEIKNGEINED